MASRFDVSTRQAGKLKFDLTIGLLILAGYTAFVSSSSAFHQHLPTITVLLRASAFLALLLFQMTLCIGPLARLHPSLSPLPGHRRHLGLCVFALALTHGILAFLHYLPWSDPGAMVDLIQGYFGEYQQILHDPSGIDKIPFEPFGALALLMLYILAATSHDSWVNVLGIRLWKRLHTLAYPAYLLVLLHVAFGYLQSDTHPATTLLIFFMALLVALLQLVAWFKGVGRTEHFDSRDSDAFVSLFQVTELAAGKPKSVRVGTQVVAIITHQNRIYAFSDACPHQGGPLGEGEIVDGFITCPWHGTTFSLLDGTCPTSTSMHLSFYPVQVINGILQIKPVPVPPELVTQGTHAPYWSSYIPRSTAQENTADSSVDLLYGLAATLVAGAPLIMAVLAALQPPAGPGRAAPEPAIGLTGVFYKYPVPGLYIPVGPQPRQGEGTTVLLSGPGQQGLPESWSALDGKKISLDGRIYHLGETTMLELVTEASPEVLGLPAPEELRPELYTVGTVQVVGELVASKCYMGAMVPGTGKIHRSCAIHSLAGGVTPGLRVRSGARETLVLLAGEDDRPLQYAPAWASQQVRVEGTLQRSMGFSVIRASTITIAEQEPMSSPEDQDRGSERRR